MKKGKKKYRFGSGVNNSSVKNYLPNPGTELAQNNINVAKAKFEANSDPMYLALKTLGNLTMQAGSAAGGTGVPGLDQTIMQFGNVEFALGGKAGGAVEVEGEEIVETPDGNIKEIKGPSHEQGGVDLILPEGSSVFSDRILIGGKTMADRKKARVKKIKSLESMLEKNPTDKIFKDSYERTKQQIDKEEGQDLQLQQFIGAVMGQEKDKAAFGLSDRPDMFSNFQGQEASISPSTGTVPAPGTSGSGGFDISSILGGEGGQGSGSFGNSVGIFGDLFSTFAPLLNTLKNRSTDTPNVNSFKDFGKDGLEAIDESATFVEQLKDNALDDINLSSNSARRSARNSARGANTQRALDLAIEQQANRSKTDVYDNVAQQMMSILNQKAGLENQQDNVIMQGEAARDLADRQDKDNYYSQLAKNISTVGQGIQQTGKDLNAQKENQIKQNLINQLSQYGITIDNKGNIVNG